MFKKMRAKIGKQSERIVSSQTKRMAGRLLKEQARSERLKAKGSLIKAKAEYQKAKGARKSLEQRSLRTKYRAAALAAAATSQSNAQVEIAKANANSELAKWNLINSMTPTAATGTKSDSQGEKEESSDVNPYIGY